MIDHRWIIEAGFPVYSHGQAEVFAVRDSSGKIPGLLALKRLRDPERTARMDREIDVMRSLEHRGVARILYDGTEVSKKGRHRRYYVMNYYERGSIAALENRDAWRGKPRAALEFLSSICDIIAVGHERHPPVIHRDIKPENILLDHDGQPIVADWGLAYVEDEQRLSVRSDAVGGYFMAPELRDGVAHPELLVPQTDIYALGKLLYWLLTGGESFDREWRYFDGNNNLEERFRNSRYQYVNAILRRSIAEDPRSRYPTVADLSREARRVAAMIESGAPAKLVVVSGDGQEVRCDSGFAAPLVVRVLDADDRPVNDIDVWWEGGSDERPLRVSANLDGIAEARPGPTRKVGNYTLLARSGELEPAVFRYRVMPGRFMHVQFHWVPSTNAGDDDVRELHVAAIDACENILPDYPFPRWTLMQGPGMPRVSVEPVERDRLEPGVRAFLVRGRGSAYLNIGGTKYQF